MMEVAQFDRNQDEHAGDYANPLFHLDEIDPPILMFFGSLNPLKPL